MNVLAFLIRTPFICFGYEEVSQGRTLCRFVAHNDAPFVAMPCKRHAVQRHHFAQYVVEGRKDLKRSPAKLREPEFVELALQFCNQFRYPFVFRKQFACSRSILCSVSFQSMKVSKQVARADKSIAKGLLHLSKCLGRLPAVTKFRDPCLGCRETLLQRQTEPSIEICPPVKGSLSRTSYSADFIVFTISSAISARPMRRKPPAR